MALVLENDFSLDEFSNISLTKPKEMKAILEKKKPNPQQLDKQLNDYASTFLLKKDRSTKRMTEDVLLSKDLKIKLKKNLLHFSENGNPIPSLSEYIDNIISDHLEKYKESFQ